MSSKGRRGAAATFPRIELSRLDRAHDGAVHPVGVHHVELVVDLRTGAEALLLELESK